MNLQHRHQYQCLSRWGWNWYCFYLGGVTEWLHWWCIFFPITLVTRLSVVIASAVCFDFCLTEVGCRWPTCCFLSHKVGVFVCSSTCKITVRWNSEQLTLAPLCSPFHAVWDLKNFFFKVDTAGVFLFVFLKKAKITIFLKEYVS